MIDWTQTAVLREGVGPDSFDEIVALFLEEVEEVVDRLRTTPDAERLEEDMHFLKGSASNLGFTAFSDTCRHAERTAASGDATDVDIAAVVDSYDASKVQFLTELPTVFCAAATGQTAPEFRHS